MSECVSVYLSVCMCACECVYVCICVYVSMCVCVCVSVRRGHISIHTCIGRRRPRLSRLCLECVPSTKLCHEG